MCKQPLLDRPYAQLLIQTMRGCARPARPATSRTPPRSPLKTYKGVDGCKTCTLGSSATTATCTECGTDLYLKTVTGNTPTTSCLDESKCKEGNTYFPTTDSTANKKKVCLSCGTAANGGIDGCAECTAPTTSGSSSSQKATCTKCASPKYLKADGTCADGCASDSTEFVKNDSTNGNKCVLCNDNNNGGIADCTQCTATAPSARSGAPLVTCSQCSNKKVRPDKKGCIQGCPENSTEASGVCECNSGYAPSADGLSCASSSANRSGLSTGAIAGISVAAVVVVGGLVGFLCWWFICRGKA